jgi:excisionase family DNA binding protein
MNENPFSILNEKLDILLKEFQKMNDQKKPVSEPNTEQQEGGIDFAVEIVKVYKKSTLYKMACKGQLPAMKRGKNLWFKREQLQHWLDAGMPDISKQKTAEFFKNRR